ncbi:MAG: hypothetical protein AB8W37_04445 [Arsenophonus endosymbiont of Dermacentor nuttalli]
MHLLYSELEKNPQYGIIEPLEINSHDEKIRYFNGCINKLMDVDNLIVLAGSGTSLTFNVQGEEKISPSTWDLWAFCKDFDEDLFGEIMEIVHYAEIQKLKEENGMENLKRI